YTGQVGAVIVHGGRRPRYRIALVAQRGAHARAEVGLGHRGASLRRSGGVTVTPRLVTPDPLPPGCSAPAAWGQDRAPGGCGRSEAPAPAAVPRPAGARARRGD